jgi:hypothetical protein
VLFSFDYARKLKGEKTALLVEAPFAAAPSHHGGSSQPGSVTEPGHVVRGSFPARTSIG